MRVAPSIFHIDRLELSLAPKAWAFATERSAEIDDYFEALKREKSALWNGRVLLMHHQFVEQGVFRGQFLEADYASFAAWRHWGRPAAGVRKMRIERLPAVTFRAHGLLLRINPFAIRVLRTDEHRGR